MSGTTCLSSGLLISGGQITAGRGTLNALTVITDGATASTITLYDNATAATGRVLAKITIGGAAGSGFQSWNLAVRHLNGIYADFTGGGAAAGYIVYYGA